MKTNYAAISVIAACGLAINAAHAEMDWGNYTFNGKVRQGYSIAYDLDEGDSDSTGPAQYIVEGKYSVSPSRNWTFIAHGWYRGDHSPGMDKLVGIGNQDFTDNGSDNGIPFDRQFGMYLNRRADGTPPVPYGDSASATRRLDNFDEITRELSVKYRDTKNRYSVKFGKFTRGWGQSDGLRLMDVLHAQDLRERFAFRDSDELRIPAWMASADFNLTRMGLAKPFEALGMQRPSIELMFIPEVHHSQFIINNPTGADPTSDGIFGLPFPRLLDAQTGWGLPFLGANLNNVTPKDFSFDDAEFGARLKFEALGGDWTINAFYGQQDLPVVTLAGANLVVGNFFGDEHNAAAVVPLDVPTTIGAVHAPGQYMDFIRSVAAGTPIAFPLEPFGCDNPLTPAAEGAPCSVNANFNLDYDHRQKLLGFSFTRDIRELKLGPKQTTPVLRVEFAYEIDKPFNRSVAPIPAGFGTPGETESSAPVLLLAKSVAITESDVASLMLGFDYPLWIPGWDSQQKSIFTSVQFFNIHTFDADDGLLQQAPYSLSEVDEDAQFATLLWNMPIVNERLVLEGLLISDINNDGLVYRQRLDFNFFGNHWRPRIEVLSFSGDKETAPAGIFSNSDMIELSLTYQF